MSAGVEITLSRDKIALVDAEDAPRVLALGLWTANWTGTAWYAVNKAGGICTYLHRFIVGETNPKAHVDHENGNTLDCRRSNLRVATPTQNNANRSKKKTPGTSRYKGVDFHAGKWRARVKVNGVQRSLGHFSTAEAAARAYDEAARQTHGAFARCNFQEVA